MTSLAETIDPRAATALAEGAIVVRAPQPGLLELAGDDAAEFLQGQVTNDIESLLPGQGAYAALLSPKGKMRADMRVLRTETALLVLTATEWLAPVRKTIDTFRIGYRFETADLSDTHALLSLAGPHSRELAAAVAASPGEHENDNAASGELLAIATLLGVDLLGPPQAIADAERRAIDAGAVAAGLDALELARIEAGIPAFGHEMTEETIPEEASINERAVSFTKGCYVGQETVARLHYKGSPNRTLRGLALDSPVEAGTMVTAGDGRELGRVGSVTISPRRGAIALAVLRREAQPGDTVDAGGVSARVTEPGVN